MLKKWKQIDVYSFRLFSLSTSTCVYACLFLQKRGPTLSLSIYDMYLYTSFLLKSFSCCWIFKNGWQASKMWIYSHLFKTVSLLILFVVFPIYCCCKQCCENCLLHLLVHMWVSVSIGYLPRSGILSKKMKVWYMLLNCFSSSNLHS